MSTYYKSIYRENPTRYAIITPVSTTKHQSMDLYPSSFPTFWLSFHDYDHIRINTNDSIFRHINEQYSRATLLPSNFYIFYLSLSIRYRRKKSENNLFWRCNDWNLKSALLFLVFAGHLVPYGGCQPKHRVEKGKKTRRNDRVIRQNGNIVDAEWKVHNTRSRKTK